MKRFPSGLPEGLKINCMLLFLRRILRPLGCLPLALIVPLAQASAQQDEVENGYIEEIRFVGNDTTKRRIMLQEMVIRAGDSVDAAKIERSRQAIMDLGLFKSVKARLLPGQEGKILEIGVDEKIYIIPLPQLDRDADGEVSYGGRLTVDNLNGLNQRLRLTYEVISGSFASDRTVHAADVFWDYPRVAGTHYGLSLGLKREVSPELTQDSLGETVAEHDRIFNIFDVGVSRWLSREGPSQGWNVGFGTFWRYELHDQQFGVPLDRSPEKAVGISFALRYTRVHNYLYSREGLEYGFVSDHGLVALGSDTPYSRNHAYYRHYFPLGAIPQHRNFNLQLRFGGTGGSVPIDDFPYILGGSRDLRGYEKDAIGGRSFFVVNLELLAPLWGYSPARGVLFADVGNAYDDNRVIDFGDLESSVGVGLRVRLKAFVDLQLRLDVSYAFGLERRKVYFGSKNTF